MIFILFATLIIVGGAFSASNYLENEILVRNKLFKQVKVNSGYKNFLFFRKKYEVLNVCLYERVFGYIVLFSSVLVISMFYLLKIVENLYYLRIYFWILLIIIGINVSIIILLIFIGKVQQKYSFGDLKNDKESLDIKEYSWNKYMPFAGDVCMFKEQGFKYLRAEECYKNGEFGYGKTEMYFNTNPPNELKRYLQNLDIICK